MSRRRVLSTPALAVVMVHLLFGSTLVRMEADRQADAKLIPPPPLIAASRGLAVSVPETLPAGASIPVEVSGADPGVEVEISIDSSYGVRRVQYTPLQSTTIIELSPYLTSASRLLDLKVVQGTRLAETTFEITPLEAVDPIPVYNGPRSIVANTETYTMQVAVPLDAFGNPVETGTTVNYRVIRSTGEEEESTDETEGLLSWLIIYSTTTAGRAKTATWVGDAGAPETDFTETADHPDDYEIELLDPLPVADGQSLVTLRTETVTDTNGNILPDGTAAVLDLTGVTGRRRIHSEILEGKAEYTIEVPSEPGRVEAMAQISGGTSQPFAMVFESAMESLAGRIVTTPDVHRIEVGPARSVRGAYVPDGTTAVVTAADGSAGTDDLVLGVGTVYFPLGTDVSEVTVEVLGRRLTLTGSDEAVVYGSGQDSGNGGGLGGAGGGLDGTTREGPR